MLFLSCFCYAFVHVCLLMSCGHLLGKGLALVCDVLLLSCHCPIDIDILGHVWCLIVSISGLCPLSYFNIVIQGVPLSTLQQDQVYLRMFLWRNP